MNKNDCLSGMTGATQHIDLGDEVMHPATMRFGRTTQVTRTHVFVRFYGADKAAYMDRRDIVSVSWENAWLEVLEDEANAAAFRQATLMTA